MQIVNPGRFLDGVVFAMFLLCLSGFSLFLFGNFHHYMTVSEASKLGVISTVFDRMFPFPKKVFAFNLTHVLLFAILITLLSMMHHPAQDVMENNLAQKVKKAEKAEKSAAEKSASAAKTE